MLPYFYEKPVTPFDRKSQVFCGLLTLKNIDNIMFFTIKNRGDIQSNITRIVANNAWEKESVITSFSPHTPILEMFDNHSFFHATNGENRYETVTSELQHFTWFSSAFRIYSARFFSSAGINTKKFRKHHVFGTFPGPSD